MEHHAEVLTGGVWYQRIPSWQDLAAVLLMLGILILLGVGGRQMLAPLVIAHQPAISLSPAALPLYTLRTVSRMMAALVASLIFTFVYATLAAKSRRAAMVLIPLLDVLQSVPILGYLSFTVVFFVSLFPGNVLGPELAAIFVIFTSQAWNMTFSFYQALKTVPVSLDEASRCFRCSAWQRFWRLEVPFAMPGLIWNMMMSMSGGWFFVVAAEAISVGNIKINLPGVGSYVAMAIQERNLAAVGWAILAMTIAIVLYDQLLFRPMVAWADKFRAEETAAQITPRSWVLDLFRRSKLARRLGGPIGTGLEKAARARFVFPHPIHISHWRPTRRVVDALWIGLIIVGLVYAGLRLIRFLGGALSWADFWTVASNGGAHAPARRRSRRHCLPGVGSDWCCRGIAAQAYCAGSACRAVSRRLSGEPAVSRFRLSHCAVRSDARDLARAAHDPGHAVVHPV